MLQRSGAVLRRPMRASSRDGCASSSIRSARANPIYRDPAAAKAAGFAATPIPPTYLFCLEMMDADDPFAMLEALDIDLRRVLHGEQKFVYHAPVVVGDELTLQSAVTGVTQKKGGAMTLIDVTTRIVNQRGQHVADAIRVVVVRNPEVSA